MKCHLYVICHLSTTLWNKNCFQLEIIFHCLDFVNLSFPKVVHVLLQAEFRGHKNKIELDATLV